MNPEVKESQISEMKNHVLKFCRPHDQKAWLMFGLSLLIETLAIAIIHAQYRLLGWTIHMLNMVRFFIQFHDMAHFSYFSSINLNKIVGKLIGILTHFPFNAWRDGHNHHHKHFGNIDRLDLSQTILFTKKQYEEMKGVKKIAARIFRQPVIFFFVTVPYFWFVGLFYVVAKRYGIFSMTFFEKIMSVVFYTFICPMVFGVPAFEMWASIYFAEIIGTVLFHLQHSVNIAYRQRKTKWDFTRAALEGSTFLHVPLILRLFTNGIEYHHIHHLNTNVPSYYIAKCHEQFDNATKEGNQWDQFSINRVGFELAWQSLKNVMLDEEKGILVPF